MGFRFVTRRHHRDNRIVFKDDMPAIAAERLAVMEIIDFVLPGLAHIHSRKGLLWKINQLLQHVERTWDQVSDDGTDPTNNVTEQLIGLTFKIRAKTMRGFKSQRKVLDHIYLSSFLRGEAGICDLCKVS